MLLTASKSDAVNAGRIIWTLVETLLPGPSGCWIGVSELLLRHARRLRHGGYASVVPCFILYGLDRG